MKQRNQFFFRQKSFLIRRLPTALLALFVFCTPFSVFADVLGTHTSTKITEYSQGTVFYTNTFDSPSVGQQTEHYVAYTPNPDITPILTNGASIYGKRNLKQANQHLSEQDIYSAIGMNADFFSLQTGVPMSNVIIERRVVSKDAEALPAIGFRKDGTAFMGELPIETTLKTPQGDILIECINKYRQPYALYLFTDEFSDSTQSVGEGINILLGSVSGSITLGSTITAMVESITTDDGPVSIPAGKLVLSVATDAEQSIKDRISNLTVGTKVSLQTKDLSNDAHWKDAEYALGNLGGKLITNGKLDVKDDAAAPRSAIGIKADGTVIFYTIDGRQTGYSYGVRKETLARRLLELGCVEAMNLDGGGSTSIGGVLPGTSDFRVLNSPSDGGLRSCANFFFLKKNNAPSGIPYVLQVSDWGRPVLSGSSLQLRVDSAYDSSYGPASVPPDIVFTLTDDADTPSPDGRRSEVSKDGFVTVRGNGDVYIKAEGGSVSGSTMLRAVFTPEKLKVYNAESGEEIRELTLLPGDALKLSATAFWGGQSMVVADESFTWRVVNDNESIGTLSESGLFTASDRSGATGIIAVNAGLCTTEIPVRIRSTEEIPPEVPRPEIQGGMEGDTLTARISCSGSTVPQENIKLYLDGAAAPFQYDQKTGKLLYTLPEDRLDQYHRLTLLATAQNGAASMAVFDFGSLSLLENPFPDTIGHWAEDTISYMASRGVVNGSSPDGSLENAQFFPDNNMTRTEFAIMLCNYLKINPDDYQDTQLPFTDAYEIPQWALDRVRAVYALGLMQGQLTDYGVEFKPNDNIKRMEYAISVCRLLPAGLAGTPITATDEKDIPFWAKESLKIAVAQGILNGYPDGTLRPSRSVTRAEAVKILYSIFGIGK